MLAVLIGSRVVGSPLLLLGLLLWLLMLLGALLWLLVALRRHRTQVAARVVIVVSLVWLGAYGVVADPRVALEPCGIVCQECEAAGYPWWVCRWLF